MKTHILCPFVSLGVTGTLSNFDIEQSTWAPEQSRGKDEQEQEQRKKKKKDSPC
jgi:hypothetical protein